MVSVFFVISGYVLSYKAIRLMRAAQYPELLGSLASSVFRRGMRLFLLITASTFISMLFCYWSWYMQDLLARNTLPRGKAISGRR
jgi:peptidoglycan/LPS O-acetylase OafA/YrhL